MRGSFTALRLGLAGFILAISLVLPAQAQECEICRLSFCPAECFSCGSGSN
jgi:hypothetical protein